MYSNPREGLGQVRTAAAAVSEGRRRSRWLDVIADPVRLQIVRLLSEGREATAAELAARSTASQQTLRRHLAALKAFGVVRTRPGQSDGETSGRPPALFSLAPDVRESVRSVFDTSR